jgi:hypothetical protein
MTVLSKIADKQPALKKELELTIQQMLPYTTPAFRARAKQVLKGSNKNIAKLTTVGMWEKEFGI